MGLCRCGRKSSHEGWCREEIERGDQVMRLAERQIGVLQKRLEVFFGTLLIVKTDGVEVWRLPHRGFPVCRRIISLSLLDPFTG